MTFALGAAPSSRRVYVGTLGVFLGAGIVSLQQRLLSTGLPDLRGALGLGFDEAAWIPTAYGMALMFMGPFTVFLGGLLGSRKVLLFTGAIFTLLSLAMPFATGPGSLIVLQILAGLASGTFYPLALSYALNNLPPRYTIYGVGAYSMELLASLSIGTPLYAWFSDHWSWRWMFWTSAVLTPLMCLCVYRAIPPAPERPGPKPEISWIGFLYASLGLALIEGALEQGERLDWLGSPTIIAMLAAGSFLLLAALFRRLSKPNPLVNVDFLGERNTLILGFGLFSMRFVLLSTLVLVPGYLGAIQGYRPLETGRVMLWLAIPVLVTGVVAASLMKVMNARLVAVVALCTVAAACLMDAKLTSDWAQDDFWKPQLLLAAGLAFFFVSEIGMIVQQGLDGGARSHPANAMTFAAFFQTCRLFGGQIGVSVIQRFITVRAVFHSSILARSVEAGDFLTDERLRALSAGMTPGSSGAEEAQGRAVATLAGQVGRQALSLTYADGFVLLACLCAGLLVAFACMKPLKKNYFATQQMALER